MFELYARILFAKRLGSGDAALPLAPSMHESKYFSYAARLFLRCSAQSRAKSCLAVDSFRNFVCGKLYDEASKLLASGTFPLQDGGTFKRLYRMCSSTPEMERDPIATFQVDFDSRSNECKVLTKAITVAARIGCRTLHKKDRDGFIAALSLLPSRSEKIQLLSSVQEDEEYVLTKKPWACHRFFSKDADAKQTSQKRASVLDLTQLLVSELEQEDKVEEAAVILEDRGYLIEAANKFDLLGSREENSPYTGKASALRVRHAELMSLCDLTEDKKEYLLSLIDPKLATTKDDKCAALIVHSVISGDKSGLVRAVAGVISDSPLWQVRAFDLIAPKSKDSLIHTLPGSNMMERLQFLHDLTSKLKQLVTAFARTPSHRSPEETFSIAQAESFFDMTPKQFDPTTLETNTLINLR